MVLKSELISKLARYIFLFFFKGGLLQRCAHAQELVRPPITVYIILVVVGGGCTSFTPYTFSSSLSERAHKSAE